jgi:hypothetical protein
MICSAVVTVVLAAFSAAVVLGTAGFASAGVTSVPVVVGVPSPSPLALIDCAGNTCQAIANSGTTVTNWATSTTAPNSVCTYAEYLENGTIIAESGTTCLSAGQQGNAD